MKFIYPDWQIESTLSYLMCVKAHSLISISRLLESVISLSVPQSDPIKRLPQYFLFIGKAKIKNSFSKHWKCEEKKIGNKKLWIYSSAAKKLENIFCWETWRERERKWIITPMCTIVQQRKKCLEVLLFIYCLAESRI